MTISKISNNVVSDNLISAQLRSVAPINDTDWHDTSLVIMIQSIQRPGGVGAQSTGFLKSR